MGRAARNSGGTGGHGYFPLLGEKPNYNRHIMTDRVLFGLVKDNQRKRPLPGGLKMVCENMVKEMLREKKMSTNHLSGSKVLKKNTTKSTSNVNFGNLLADKNFKTQDECVIPSTNMKHSKRELSEKKRWTTLSKTSSSNKSTSTVPTQSNLGSTEKIEKLRTPEILRFEQATIQQVL